MVDEVRKEYRQGVNMPQMALTGLSESWLMKEIGDCHWHMLCEDLGLKSNEIFDDIGNRLYATFIRIKFESRSSLKDFQENELLEISGTIKRIGNTLYFSNIDICCNDKVVKCSLATTFSTRESDADNTKLTKGVPSTSDDTAVAEITKIPGHVLDIVRLKKNTIKTLLVRNHSFDLTDDVVFETSYKINPYTDINGVGLLYFASYPLINDVCELEFFNNRRKSATHWALNSSTMTRDVFYFANCNIEDAISYRLNSYQTIDNNQIALQSSLYRESDNVIIAKLFTIKQLST
jgi:probable biosynthetic protein (TIGR04098 family)